MDAQNAAESQQTKPADQGASALSPQREPQPKDPSPDKKDDGDKPAKPERFEWAGAGDDASDDPDSDAETVVLPGKDGHSPSKARKVRQEDKSESDGDAASKSVKPLAEPRSAPRSTTVSNGDGHSNDGSDKNAPARPTDPTAVDTATGPIVKKKRLAGSEKDRLPRSKDASSGLSSAPTSPPPHHRRQRSDDGPRSSPSDSERSHHNKSSPKGPLRDRIKSTERLLPQKRKATKNESDGEAESRKPRRQRTSSVGVDAPPRPLKDGKPASVKQQSETRNRSVSPPPRTHRRSASTVLPPPSSSNLSQKRRRVPPGPIQLSDGYSDSADSDDSANSHNHSHARSRRTPGTADSNVSPAKMAPHKKHLDAHGQTLLARACAKREYDAAKHRLTERPEDLNVADYAGNTPLQIAAINGAEDIVKLLIDAGCNLDCVNYDKDTPLLDAVDNDHLGVIKLLLSAGVNPRKANVNGEEPIDRVDEESEHAAEIRTALMDARKKAGDRRRTSEDRQDSHDARDSHAPDSPRRSPTAGAQNASSRRSATVRSTKTRNDLLYMPLDEKTLLQAAGRGDEETVARILQVKENIDHRRSMVAAARGGHEPVIQLLLGLGGANPDPGPVDDLLPDFSTPILAAIGQENIEVLRLLLDQQGFDPTRRYCGDTYYEIAKQRGGANWKDEEQLLKDAYDNYKRSRKEGGKTKSPARRDDRRIKRDDTKDESRAHRRNTSSPTRDTESRKKSSSKLSSPREKRRSGSFANNGEENPPKRGPGRPRKEDKTISANPSERETSPTMLHKVPKTKRAESDVAGVSSEGEAFKPRRKLISKGELRGERDKHRRSSMASNASSLKEPSSPHDSRNDEPSDKHKLSEKYHDRTKALKRDDSRDRLPVSGDASTKRHRTSVTPDRPSNGEKDNEVPAKRRRLDGQIKEKRQKRPLSADGSGSKSNSQRDGSAKPSAKLAQKPRDDDSKDGNERNDSSRRASGLSSTSEKSVLVKTEDVDVEMTESDMVKPTEAETHVAAEEQAKKKKLAEAEDAKKAEALKIAEVQMKKEHEREEAQKKEEEVKQKKDEELQALKKREEEEERKLREKAERERREAEEATRHEQEEKERVEEEKRKAERDEEERKRREEEERLHKEQLEREAAEEAQRKREEEERRERERLQRERLQREEVERKRAARDAELKRLREEQERIRLDKLPPLLRWLDTCPNPKTSYHADLFKRIQGVRYDTIRPEENGTEAGREQWVLNTHVALLLGEKDLSLSRYTAWDRKPASQLAKLTLWRVESQLYSLVSRKLWDLGRQLPEYYDGQDPTDMSFETQDRLRLAAWDRFRNTDMFFVKLSDFLYTVSNISHLREIKLDVEYRELLESESQAMGFKTLQKWKQDPDADRFHGFAPRHKYYIGGVLVGEELPIFAQTSKTPFPEKRVPRRGVLQVYPNDPDYARICLEQGLGHLVKGRASPVLPNGVHSSPHRNLATPVKTVVNGTNGHAIFDASSTENGTNGRMLNGVHGSST